MSIKKKLLALIVSLVILSMGCTGLMTYFFTSKSLINSGKENIKVLSKEVEKAVEIINEEEKAKSLALSNFQNIHSIVNFTGDKNGEEYKKLLNDAKEILKQHDKKQGNLEHSFVVDKDGNIVADSDENLIGKSINDREYNKRTLEGNGEQIISETLISKSTGAPIVVFTTPIMDNNKIVGYAATAVKGETLSKYLKDIKIANSPSSYVYLVDEKGNMIYHPQKEKIGKPVENEKIKAVVGKTEVKDGENVVEYDFNGSRKIAVYQIVPATKWIIVSTADVKEFKSSLTLLTKWLSLIYISVILISIIVGALYAKKIANPIMEITQLVNSTAELDLIQNDKYDKLFKYNDEIGTMFKSIMDMRSSLREMVQGILKASEDLNDNADLVFNLTEELKLQADKTAEETEQLSAGMEESAATIEEISASSSEMPPQLERWNKMLKMALLKQRIFPLKLMN